MNRRDMLAAAGSGVTAAAAMAMTGVAHASHHKGGHHKNPWADLAKTTAECVGTGEICVSHCVSELSKGNKDMGECLRTVNDMLALCGAMTTLAAANSDRAKDIAQACIKACEVCRDECKKHAKHHATCKACMESCEDCIKSCKKTFKI